VLVIEDDPDVRTLVAEVCRLQGHEVLEAATGAEAIELGTSGQPDLVLVDWVLPDISGTEVILELRRQGVVSPMVMLTGRSTKTDEVVGLEIGADDYITKPFDSRVLAARINAHLRRTVLAEASGGREGVLTIGALQIDSAGCWRSVASRRARMPSVCSTNVRPAAVKRTPRGRRSSKVIPTSASNAAICWETADCV